MDDVLIGQYVDQSEASLGQNVYKDNHNGNS